MGEIIGGGWAKKSGVDSQWGGLTRAEIMPRRSVRAEKKCLEVGSRVQGDGNFRRTHKPLRRVRAGTGCVATGPFWD